MSCPQSQKIEKGREKEEVGDRPAKLNAKKSDREVVEREIENKGARETVFVGRKFCSGGEKMRNASGHRGFRSNLAQLMGVVRY